MGKVDSNDLEADLPDDSGLEGALTDADGLKTDLADTDSLDAGLAWAMTWAGKTDLTASATAPQPRH